MEDIETLPDFHSHNFLFDSINNYDRDFSNFRGLLIFQVNARSICKISRFDQLKFVIEQLKRKPDVIVVSETWVSNDLIQLYRIDGYNSVFSCRKNGTGGGLVVFVLDNLTFTTNCSLELSSVPKPINFIQISISVSNNRSIVVSAYYRPPDDRNLTDFFNHLELILSASNSIHVLVGDINIDSSSSSNKFLDYLNILTSYGFLLTNTNITRPSSSSILDHVAFNHTDDFTVTNDTITNPDSDHNFILSLFDITPISTPAKISYKHQTNYVRLEQLLEMRFNPVYMGNFDDPNEFYNYFISTLTKSIQESTIITELKSKSKHICPWFSDGLKTLLNSSKNLRKKRNKLFAAGKSTSEIDSKIHDLTNKIRTYSNTLQTQYYTNKFANASNAKDTWKNINDILGRKIHSKLPTEMLITDAFGNDEKINNAQLISNEFNNYFSSIGEKMANKIPSFPNDNINKFKTLKRPNSTFFLTPISQTEIFDIINSLKNNTACGNDHINAFTLKKINHIISPVLAEIFNLCIILGVYPDKLKVAKVTPIHKSGSTSSFNNYRPISVLSAINKVFEKLLFNRLTTFLNSNNFFCHQQYGFRERSSTFNAVVDLVNKIQHDLDNRDDVLGLFLDLSKAFDTVDRRILFEKLKFAGIHGVALDLFKSYLTNRSQFVCFNGISSLMNLIDVGVPQGSVLGPLFFIIYLNDFSRLPLKGDLRLFADDSSLFYNSRLNSVNDLNLKHDLLIVSEYFRINKLTLNINKTNIINIKNSSLSTPNPLIQTKIEFPDIDIVSEFKYLGILLDSRLNWSSHVNSLILKLNKITGIVFKIKHKLPRNVLILIYHSLFNSLLSYLTAVWGNTYDYLLNKLQIVQNKFLKSIFNLPLRSHTVDLYTKEKNIMPVRGIYIIQVCSFIYKSLSNQTHTNTKFELSSHQHGTRNHNLLKRPNVSTLSGERSITFKGANYFNFFFNKFGLCSSLSIFKDRLKLYLAQPEIVEKLIKSIDILS